MKKIIFGLLLLICLVFTINAQTSLPSKNEPNTQKIPENFVSDGCTHFPDGDYRDCCVAHDIKYYYGGSWKQRWRADNELRKCVAAKPGFQHKPISIMMWLGVRAFGGSWLHKPYSWGFGKDLIKK